MAEETGCLQIVELIKRHTATAHDPNVSSVNMCIVFYQFILL